MLVISGISSVKPVRKNKRSMHKISTTIPRIQKSRIRFFAVFENVISLIFLIPFCLYDYNHIVKIKKIQKKLDSDFVLLYYVLNTIVQAQH